MRDDAAVRSTWRSIFSRKGGSGATTRLWDEWEDNVRAVVLADVGLEGEELPVILTLSAGGGRMLLTTRRLISDSGVAPVSEIVRIQPVDFNEKRKEQLDELHIDLVSGKALQILVEAGKPYFGLWSVLMNVAGRNAREVT